MRHETKNYKNTKLVIEVVALSAVLNDYQIQWLPI